MGFLVLITPLINVLMWVLLCFILLACGRYLKRFNPAMPSMWWGVLLISVLPFAGLDISARFVAIPEVLFDVSEQTELLQLHTELVTQSSLNGDASILFAILLCIYLTVTFKRLHRFWHNRSSVLNLLTTGEKVSIGTRNVDAVMLPINCSPFVTGVFKSRLALPKYFMELPKEQKQALLNHELVHIDYRDHQLLTCWHILCCIFWFNPALVKMEVELGNAIEARCDKSTLSKYGINPKVYAQAMLTALKYNNTNYQQHSTIAFASRAMSLADYKLRLTQIMRPTKSSPSRVVIALMLCTLTSVAIVGHIKSLFIVQQPNWQAPINQYSISSHFGHISAFRDNRSHGGVDLVAPKGQPIASVATGKVLVADAHTLPTNYGKVVLIQHSNGYQSLYAHLDQIWVAEGDWVPVGKRIGTLGESGKVTGPHLHLEVLHEGQRVDPLTVVELN
ncbi:MULTISPECIES: M23/M56 family metallopeptidase [Pseudoalteromonas]|uniref:Peptidase M23 n=1 Tax=Pseudoalteromonas amylolytica TaxID=1859457 RepID=A0A1S1MPQ9_9GAMM|nr:MULTISPECIES: M23/M56 family metallopeptidase [Pseudoalteromonas]OHU84308.1 hypothetical protein BFC16_01310 [Pseudoalteromonas sp. JW3]OHU87153.1 hypothetical protein BET10_00630 [Pseudoalteromonas amylolytica]